MAVKKIKVPQEMIEAAKAQIEAQNKANPQRNGRIGNCIDGLESKAVGDFSANLWAIGDTFTVPDTLEELDKMLVYETYPNLPLNSDGTPKDGYYLLVGVDNNGSQSMKHFRPGNITASFPEYRRDESTGCFLATGKTIQSNTTLATVLRMKANQKQQYEALLGKTIKVTGRNDGNAAKMQDGRVIDLKARSVYNFEEVTA